MINKAFPTQGLLISQFLSRVPTTKLKTSADHGFLQRLPLAYPEYALSLFIKRIDELIHIDIVVPYIEHVYDQAQP